MILPHPQAHDALGAAAALAGRRSSGSHLLRHIAEAQFKAGFSVDAMTTVDGLPPHFALGPQAGGRGAFPMLPPL